MRAAFVLLGLVAFTLAIPQLKNPRQQTYPVEQEYTEFQTGILRLFKNINNKDFFSDQVEIATKYDIQANIGNYVNPKVVNEFLEMYQRGVLPQGEVFSIFYGRQQIEAIALYKLFYSAKDLMTLYKTACWARLNINEGMFIYAMTVAVVQRPDTTNIVLPPIYEIYPNFFFDAEVIQQAQLAVQSFGKLPETLQNQQEGLPWLMPQLPISGMQEQMPTSWMQERMQQMPMSGMQQVPMSWMQGQTKQIPSLLTRQRQTPTSWITPGALPSGQSNIGQRFNSLVNQLNPQMMGQAQPLSMQKMPVSSLFGVQPPIQYQFNPQMVEQGQPQVRPGLWSNIQKMPISGLPYGQGQQQPYIAEMSGQQPLVWWKQTTQQGQVPIRQGFMYGQQFTPEIVQRTRPLMGQFLPQQMPEQQQLYLQQNGFTGITIDSNITNRYMTSAEGQIMAYFTEDVGLNALYYYYNMYYPFWLSSDEMMVQSQRRGEQFYYIYQQLLARFYLERLSNGLGDIPTLDYSKPITTGYYSSLSYPNGNSFPGRPNDFMLPYEQQNKYPVNRNYSSSYTFVEDYERRIRDAIDLGYIYSEDGKMINLYQQGGMELLGSMIEGNPDSPQVRFYGTLQILARHLLGNSRYPYDQYKIAPSVLEQFETSLRDPVFYQFYKRIITYFLQYKNYLPKYMQEDLMLPGVQIQSVQIDELVTYFDDFYIDITNALQSTGMDSSTMDLNVRVRQPRLNNKPFTYTISALSEQPMDSIVKVFIGPKYDENGMEIDMTVNRLNFVEIDKFPVTLKSGVNTIQRSSMQSYYPSEPVTYKEIYMNLMKGFVAPAPMVGGLQWVIPNRLLLPKGTKQGMMYQMYVMITPQSLKEQHSKYPRQNMWGPIFDSLPLGYPFDKEIDDSVTSIPNSYMRDIVIYNVNVEYMTPGVY